MNTSPKFVNDAVQDVKRRCRRLVEEKGGFFEECVWALCGTPDTEGGSWCMDSATCKRIVVEFVYNTIVDGIHELFHCKGMRSREPHWRPYGFTSVSPRFHLGSTYGCTYGFTWDFLSFCRKM